MKFSKLFLTVMSVLLLFSSCGINTEQNKNVKENNNQEDSKNFAATDDFDNSTFEDAASDTSKIKDNENLTNIEMQNVEFVIDTVIYSFDWTDERNIDDFKFIIDIPDYMEWSEDGQTYLRLNTELDQYLPGIESSIIFQVNKDFVMNKNVHNYTYSGDPWNPLTDWEVSSGTTSNGYDYVLYETEDNEDFNEFYAYVYVRLSDEYIGLIKYRDCIDYKSYLSRSIDSIKVQ